MIEIQEMNNGEIDALLERTGFGHLGCAQDNVPYVVPIHFAYNKPVIYIYTTEGKKYEIIHENPNVCLQVEEIKDNSDWRSIIVTGEAAQVTDPVERERAVKLITERNPTLTPAISIRWMDNWIRENREVVYRITPSVITGRSPVKVRARAAFAQPASAPQPRHAKVK